MAKTDWGMNDVVMPDDMNQIGQEINKNAADIAGISGGTNQTVREQVALILETDTRKTVFEFTGGVLSAIVQKDGATEVSRTTLNYTSGALSSLVQVAGGKTVTSTINRDGSGIITDVTKGVS
ncbi:hypothetical protein [Cohnella caldifontis]|uniref:hypothetical protein n=1 Tax=Cohnella caldifontis TaxID=3027471 RepID=UPI0023EBF4D4|nr:hypothetical protein [Cohnella sp. YIM B05605]